MDFVKTGPVFEFPYSHTGPLAQAKPNDDSIQKTRGRPRVIWDNEDERTSDADEAEARASGLSVRKRDIDRSLARLKPPLPVESQVGPGGAQTSLRRRHISVLVAVVHRCLREGDFVRAGRAWGILLRTEFYNQHIDLRNRALYGIGAELLLRTSAPSGMQRGAHSGAPASRLFSRAGFQAAKAYYERLAVEYPYRNSPLKRSALDFHIVMYGLWIATVQEGGDAPRRHRSRSHDSTDAADGRDAGDVQRRAQEATLAEALQIEAALTELTVAPPYSESSYLQEMKRMVQQWTRDLEGVSAGPGAAARVETMSSSPEP